MKYYKKANFSLKGMIYAMIGFSMILGSIILALLMFFKVI